MVVANNEIDATKNAGKLTTILMTMRMRRCHAGHHRGGRHGLRFWLKSQNTNKKTIFS